MSGEIREKRKETSTSDERLRKDPFAFIYSLLFFHDLCIPNQNYLQSQLFKQLIQNHRT